MARPTRRTAAATPTAYRPVRIVIDRDRTTDSYSAGCSVSVAGTFVYSSRFGSTWLFDRGDAPHIAQAYCLLPHVRPGPIDTLWDRWCTRSRAVTGRVTYNGEVRTRTAPTPEERDEIAARLAQEGVRVTSWVCATGTIDTHHTAP
jgi:hypothetical protein